MQGGHCSRLCLVINVICYNYLFRSLLFRWCFEETSGGSTEPASRLKQGWEMVAQVLNGQGNGNMFCMLVLASVFI